MTNVKDVFIDTSSLNPLLKDNTLGEKFKAKITREPYRLIVSGHVIEEILAGELRENIVHRANSLGTLWQQLGNLKFTIARDLRAIVIEELEHPLIQTPTVSSDLRRVLLARLLRLNLDSPDLESIIALCNGHREGKDTGLSMDRRVMELVASKPELTTQEHISKVIEIMKAYGGPLDDFKWYLESVLKDRPSKISELSMRDLREGLRYPVTRAFASLGQLNMFGVSLVGRTTDEIAARFRTQRNTWYDASIIGSAAYSARLIVDDRGALDRAKFLAGRGIVKFEAITLDEFLGK